MPRTEPRESGHGRQQDSGVTITQGEGGGYAAGRLLLAGAAIGALAMFSAATAVSGASTTTDTSTTTATTATPSTSSTTPPPATTTTLTVAPTTTLPISVAPTTSPFLPLDVTIDAAADCYYGIPVVRADVTALHDINGGEIHLQVEPDYFTEAFAVVPPMSASETRTFLIPEREGRSVTVMLFWFYNVGGRVTVDMPWETTCPLPAGSPTVTAAVERSAGDDAGGAIAVTMTNPAGGPERDMAFSVTWKDEMQTPVDYREWSSLPNGVTGPADGEQATVIVDEYNAGRMAADFPSGNTSSTTAGWSISPTAGPSTTTTNSQSRCRRLPLEGRVPPRHRRRRSRPFPLPDRGSPCSRALWWRPGSWFAASR